MPWSTDRFDAYFKMKNNIDSKMRFADRIYKHCFNDGILTGERVTAVWDSSCKVISKAMLCEIARWGDERGLVYDHENWKSECKDVHNDLLGRSDLYVAATKQSGMYPNIDPPVFKNGSSLILSSIHNCPENWKASNVFGTPGRPNSVFAVTSINQEKDIFSRPSKLSLSQNYPNPFNPTTHITT